MAERLTGQELINDLSIRFGLPKCYRENFLNRKSVSFQKNDLSEISNALKGFLINKPKGFSSQKRTADFDLARGSLTDTDKIEMILGEEIVSLKFNKYQRYSSLGVTNNEPININDLFGNNITINIVQVGEVYCRLYNKGKHIVIVETKDQEARYYRYSHKDGKYYRMEETSTDKKWKRVRPYQHVRDSKAIEDFHENKHHDITIEKKDIKAFLTIAGHAIIQHKDGNTYVFAGDKKIKFINDKKNLIEGWMITDDIMVLKYDQGTLVKLIKAGFADDVFIVVNIKEGRMAGSFKGSFEKKYMEYNGEILPCFEKHKKIEIQTSDNNEIAELFLTSPKEKSKSLEDKEEKKKLDILVRAETLIKEMSEDYWGVSKAGSEKSLALIKRSIGLLIKANKIIESYTMLQEKITERRQTKQEEDKTIKKLKEQKNEFIALIKEELHHASFMKIIKTNEGKPGYNEIRQEIGNRII